MFMSMYPLHWAGSALETIIKIIFYLLVVIGQWRIFEKAGENGWKSLIPIYNVYILYKIIWDTRIFWIELALSLFLSIVPLIGIIGAIGIFFIDIAATAKLSFAFGHGLAFIFGLIFLRPLFVIILGFGSSQYYGR